MPISLTNAGTNDGIDTDSLIGVSNTNDTKRTSIKQQQHEANKITFASLKNLLLLLQILKHNKRMFLVQPALSRNKPLLLDK